MLRHLGGHGVEQRQFLDARFEMFRGDGAGVACIAGLGEMRDDFGRFERCDGVEGQQSRIAGTDADAYEAAAHIPSLASALTAAAVMALPPMRPRTTR